MPTIRELLTGEPAHATGELRTVTRAWVRCTTCRRLRSFAARVGQDSGRSAPCVQPKTPDEHQRENVRSARDVSPRSVQFSVAKSVQFSVAIDRPI